MTSLYFDISQNVWYILHDMHAAWLCSVQLCIHYIGILLLTFFKRYVHTCAGGRGRARAEAGGKLASTQIITCVHTCAVAERRRSGSKNRSARNGSNTQFAASTSKPRAPNHHCPQEMADPPASAPRPLRVCVNIPAVAERECRNPPASAPQPPRACVNVAKDGSLAPGKPCVCLAENDVAVKCIGKVKWSR